MTDDALSRPRPIDLPTELPLDGAIDAAIADNAKIFAAPADPADWPRWRQRLAEWRAAARLRWPLPDAAYSDASTAWASRCFSVALVWLWDERLFDHTGQRFDVDGFLIATADYGGFDAVVLWQAYPIIGVDERTQFDFYRDVPGIAELVRAFQRHGINVFVDYNPWDTATTDAARHPELVAALAADLGADGVFLDTMREGGAELRQALSALPHPPVLEGESRVSLERIGDHQLSWAQWFADSDAPGVLRARWFERRHLLHHTRRWNRDHSDELQSAWMNGAGVLVWDAVFGSWVGWNDRDKSTLRAMVRVQRALADVLTDGEWTPLVDADDTALAAGVHVSRFELGDVTLWTAINRSTADYRGPALAGELVENSRGACFDVTAGVRLASAADDVFVPARGVAGIVAVSGAIPDWLERLVSEAAADPHASSVEFPVRPMQRTLPSRSERSRPDRPVVEVGPGRFDVEITYRLRETGMYDGAPFVEAWKPLPPLLHSVVGETRTVDIGAVAVARHEVSNDEFRAFVEATGYGASVTSSAGGGPVTFVDLGDARAYAAWRGARLPTEFEWQLAADQAGFARLEPLVWNLTESAHTDGVTRFVILKGGSDYEAAGSEWYFDGGRRDPSFCAKLLLAGLGVSRSSRIGFRLAWDLEAAEHMEKDAQR
jgi:hypothetical protein